MFTLPATAFWLFFTTVLGAGFCAGMLVGGAIMTRAMRR